MVAKVVLTEERRFGHTIAVGLRNLEADLRRVRGEAESKLVYPGDSAFRLYDTYGLPRDFIEDVCRDAGIPVDWEGFDRAMEEQRARGRA